MIPNPTEVYLLDQEYTHTNLDMCCKENVLMTVGTSMCSETCRIHGQDSRSSRCWAKNFLQDRCRPGSDLSRFKQQPDLTVCGLKFGTVCQNQLRRRRSKNGEVKIQSLTTLEDWEAFSSSIRKMRKEKVGSSDADGHALQERNEKALKRVAGNCSKWSHRIQQQDKACVHRGSSQVFLLKCALTPFFVCVDPGANPSKKRFILTTHENCEEFISSTLRIRNSKKPSRTRVRSWKHQWLLLKYRGRVVLRGDIVKKDDFGACAVFTEQKLVCVSNDSSESNGCHCKIAWLCRTSSRRSVSKHPSSNGGCSKIIEKFQNRSVQTFGFVYRDTNGQNHGPVWKTRLFLLKGICTVILWQDYCGKGNLRKSYWNMAGRKFQNPIVKTP